MEVTLETIHKEIQQVKGELSRMRNMLEDEDELTDGARRELVQARQEMANGEYIRHEEVMVRYG